jgi:hypothetical protein
MYCFQSQDDTALSLFESLTKQLVATMIVTSTPCSPEILLALEKAYGNEASRPEVSQVITDLVLPLCSHLPEITLVIDGVDEREQTELRLLVNERRFLWIHLVLQIILDECRSPFEVEEAVERLPPGLEAICSRCLAKNALIGCFAT